MNWWFHFLVTESFKVNFDKWKGIPFPICEGSNFQCTEPVIQLYVEYHNHRLIEYLDVLRVKSIPLKINEIVYILKTVCLGIILLTSTYWYEKKKCKFK